MTSKVTVHEGYRIRASLMQPYDRDAHLLNVLAYPPSVKPLVRRPFYKLYWEGSHPAYWKEVEGFGEDIVFEGNNLCITGLQLHLSEEDIMVWANGLLDTLLPPGTRVKWLGLRPVEKYTHITA